MTAPSGNLGADTAPRASHFVACVKIYTDVLVVSVKQPVDATNSERQAYNSAHRQCWGHMISHPPSSFDVSVTGDVSSPLTEITIRGDLLGNLPLLQDVSGSTTASSDEHASERESTACRETTMSLPCSIWGLVSLLLLLEGGITLKTWFSTTADADPSLPAQTLEVADFIGCKQMKQYIIQWLIEALQDVVQHSKMVASNQLITATLYQSCPRIWHLTQVLRSLHGDNSRNVFSKISTSASCDSALTVGLGVEAEDAAHLPQDLLIRWVDSVAPTVDLRPATLSIANWERLAACFACRGSGEVKTLHVPIPESSQMQVTEVESLRRFCETAEQSESTCGSCGDGAAVSPSHFAVGFKCTSCSDMCVPNGDMVAILQNDMMHEQLRKLQTAWRISSAVSSAFCCACHMANGETPRHAPRGTARFLCVGRPCILCEGFYAIPNTSVYRLEGIRFDQKPVGSAADSISLLCTLGGALSNMPRLQHLGLHSIPLSSQCIPALGQLLTNTSSSVSILTVTMSPATLSCFGALEKTLFLRAVVQLRSLKELHMPQWEEFVGDDAGDCVEVLRSLPFLEAVVVSKVNETDAFPAGICFRQE